jgi:serine protease Do
VDKTESNSEQQSFGVNTPSVDGSKKPVQKEPKLWKAVALRFFALLIASAVLGGMVGGAYLLGKTQPRDIEAQRQTVVQEGEVIANVAEEVGQSVVSIVSSQQTSATGRYFGGRAQTAQAAGTGVIISTDGYILTNKHVVPEGLSNLKVVTSDGTSYGEVDVIGRDTLNDLAILKVKNPKDFKEAKLADSDKVRTGQKVIAIGNALGQFQNTVTSGIISGMGRPVEAGDQSGNATEQLTNLFQTDAAINSGNSGGPLLNFNGEVIGINTAVAADAENIGFAIPINEAKGIIESVKTSGRIIRPYLGVQYVMLTPDSAKELNLSVTDGAYIGTDPDSVVSGGPANKAGIQGGDVITKVNNTTLSDTTSLAAVVGRYKVGDKVELTVIRDGKERKIQVTLAEVPRT